jgi:hypothetical protein
MTEVENLMELIRRLLAGEMPPGEFDRAYMKAYSENRGSDPYVLYEAFESLWNVVEDFVEDDELRDPENDADLPALLSAAEKTYVIASDIIRRRGLHNIR